MQKREKMMLAGVAVALAVAGVMHFSGPAAPPPGSGPEGPKLSLDEVTKAVEQAKLTPQQAYRIALLAANATDNPFYGGTAPITQEEDRGLGGGGGGGEAAPLAYSGYIKVGTKTYAVVNGMEYAVGDELAEGGYQVKAIDKSFVLLERTDGSTGRRLSRRVPLVEDDTDKIRIRVVKRR
jgi:hypothetical protein